MRNYKQQFKNKKITIMGLGILGRGLGYTKFLAESGADLIVTDLKSKKQLAISIKALNKFKNIKFVLGKHRLEDFKERDMIIKAAGVPRDSIYIKEAKKNKIPVEMDVSLFIKVAPEIIVIGITGTRGKSMTTAIIYKILKDNIKDKNIYLGGNVRGIATLPFLKKIKEGDIMVCELDSWQLQGFDEAKISPNISVFTTFMPDHMNYYNNSMKKYFNDKANIFKYQKKDDILIIRPEIKNLIPKNIKSKKILINKKNIASWKFIVPGEHNRENLACAIEVAKQFDISIAKIKKSVRNFRGLEGRLQLLKIYRGIKIYNDNNATTPTATTAGIEALSDVGRSTSRTSNVRQIKKIILICGGSDKKLELKELVKSINKYCKEVITIPGTGTDKLLNLNLKIESKKAKNLNEAVKLAVKSATRGDIILFSPAFASFGTFSNEYERNDLFIKIIKGLK